MNPRDCSVHEEAHALKDWAVVCEALRSGHQSVLLRTGGIREDHGEFRIKSDRFWLFPTRFHQTVELITPEFAEKMPGNEVPIASSATANEIPIQVFCEVQMSCYIDDLSQLSTIRNLHVLKDEVTHQRFEYRSPGLTALFVRAFSFPKPVLVEHTDQYDGCKSWLTLSVPLSTSGLNAVLSDEEFERRIDEFKRATGSSMRLHHPSD
ncbi:DUF1802 family protein [Thalassoglobus neptunius]|nr:DUF1802 family protein [Thalassoglobus neptunius]